MDNATRKSRRRCVSLDNSCLTAAFRSYDSVDDCIAAILDGVILSVTSLVGDRLAVGQVVGDPVESVGERMTGQIESGLSEQLPVSRPGGVTVGRPGRRAGRSWREVTGR